MSDLGPIFTSVAGTELTDEERERLSSPAVGGVVLFDSNCEQYEQTKKLTADIHSLKSPPLIVAIDQEGGRVQRLKDGVTILPPQKLFGEMFDKDSKRAYRAAGVAGNLMARELRELDIDLSFSPVLDVRHVESKIIGSRSFDHRPLVVAMLASSWMRGMEKAGMKSVGKHFPGHGAVTEDSHKVVPKDYREFTTLKFSDLIPYRCLSSRLPAIMTAHVLYPNINAAVSTYSQYWLGQVLRGKYAFDGAVFSDDLSMIGATYVGDIETRVSAALMGGCDFVLICQSTDETDRAINMLSQNNTVGWERTSQLIERLRPDSCSIVSSIDEVRKSFFEIIDL